MKELRFEEGDFKKIFMADTPMAIFWRRVKRLLKQLLAVGALYFLFFILLNYGAYWTRFQYTVSTSPEPTVIVNEPVKPVINYQPQLQIPKIGVDAPLIMGVSVDLIIAQLKNGVVHYADTAQPGQLGNVVIVGHSSDFPWSDGQYKNVFALLDKMVAGDNIVVLFGSEKYVYSIISSRVVGPNELSVLGRTDQPILTLLTCYPVGTSRNRLIVTARLISNNVGSQQTTDPLTGDSLPRPR